MDIFCKIIAGEIPANVCYENEDVISIMDASPSSPGHLLVIPKKHYTTVLDMDDEITCKINKVAQMLIGKMEKEYPSLIGIRLVVNYGDPQKVKHYHLHLIPVYSEGKEPSMNQEEFCNLLKKGLLNN